MTKLNLVLSVSEIQAISNDAGPDNPLGLARAVERATLEHLSKRPPAAWQQLVYELCVREATRRNMLPQSIYNCMMKGTGNGGLYPDPLVSLAELALTASAVDVGPSMNAVEQATLAKLTPNMFWDASWPERCEESIHNVLVAMDAEVGTKAEIQRAVSLENITIEVTGYNEDENEYAYMEVKND